MFKLKLTARARRELKSITSSHREILAEIFEDLKSDPLIGKPLTRNLEGKRSYRVGVFRIIYKVQLQDKVVLVLTVGHRTIIYN